MLLAVHLFQLDHVELPANRFVAIGDQLEREALLGLEVLVRLEAIPRDAEDDRVGGLELADLVAEVAALGGAARGAVLGIEIDHYLLATVVAETKGRVAGGLGGEVFDGLSNAEGHEPLRNERGMDRQNP